VITALILIHLPTRRPRRRFSHKDHKGLLLDHEDLKEAEVFEIFVF